MKKRFRISLICIFLIVTVMLTALPASATVYGDIDNGNIYDVNTCAEVAQAYLECYYDDYSNNLIATVNTSYFINDYTPIPMWVYMEVIDTNMQKLNQHYQTTPLAAVYADQTYAEYGDSSTWLTLPSGRIAYFISAISSFNTDVVDGNNNILNAVSNYSSTNLTITMYPFGQ